MRKGLSYSEAGRLGWESSKETQQRQKTERIENYYKNPKKCRKCDDVIPYEKKENKYCSRSCAISVNNRGVRRHGHRDIENCLNCGETLIGKSGKKYCSRFCAETKDLHSDGHVQVGTGICLNCGKDIVGRNKNKKRYCDRDCDIKYRWKLKKEAIEKDPNSVGIRALKRFVVKERGHKCEKCGISEWFGQSISLDMHHIDGNYKNNSLDNLKLLCPNCHAITPTYKGKNAGNGRAKRRQRYREGKSY